ncbi:MAG: 16S rRNA (guanine(966)-N(2))-methyltransferase RsmD [Vallitaleaceae bacterium]|nr:16S rRNA (guanine(966)-N(2))-methyltransferase RsmD [Vallitaleaceae bacterium]
MRVIAGSARSLPLSVPEGKDIRPTTDRYKETVFNILRPYIFGSNVLDLFSGTGSIGIEALSRGATRCVFVENHKTAITCIEKNLNFTKLFEKAEIMKYDYSKALMDLGNHGIQFDLIYLDPPFDQGMEEETISQIHGYDLLKDDGIMVCESSLKTDMSFIEKLKTYEIIKERTYITCKFSFIRKLKTM